MTRARRYASGGPVATPVRRRPALRLAGPGTGVELLPGLQEDEAVVAAPLPPPPSLEATQTGRARPYLRALRWAGGLIALIVVGYLAWVSFALWRLEQRIVVPL